jgi:hypothetical protein
MDKPRNPKRSTKVLTLFFILFSASSMNCTHDFINRTIFSLRSDHTNQDFFSSCFQKSRTAANREPVSIPPVRISPDGKPFLIYGLGFICVLAWGSIRRKRESATGHLQKNMFYVA